MRDGGLKANKFLNRLCSLLFTVYCLLSLGCGYTLHTRAELPFDTVAIGKIENKTLEPKLQDKLSRILAETFSEYGFVASSSARYKVEVDIYEFKLEALNEQDLVATEYRVYIKGHFKLIDRERDKIIPLEGVDSPFETSFGSSGKLENVIAQKELSINSALKNLSEELVRRIIYNLPKTLLEEAFKKPRTNEH
ncbi:MAG: hypothetical protein C0415_05820 [Thermodesulfovibrio sp.]|nr:hypothetical protein [Thermodesulfovibrio sp.]